MELDHFRVEHPCSAQFEPQFHLRHNELSLFDIVALRNELSLFDIVAPQIIVLYSCLLWTGMLCELFLTYVCMQPSHRLINVFTSLRILFPVFRISSKPSLNQFTNSVDTKMSHLVVVTRSMMFILDGGIYSPVVVLIA
jgi:hypothetical protein